VKDKEYPNNILVAALELAEDKDLGPQEVAKILACTPNTTTIQHILDEPGDTAAWLTLRLKSGV
jgi:hypothetical protein